MMPPFVVFPTNRIAHFVEVSLYLFYLAQQVKLCIINLLAHEQLILASVRLNFHTAIITEERAYII